MSVEAQERLVGEPEGTRVEIETSGRVIRPLLQPIDALVDECRIHCSEGGLHVSVIDPASVGMVELDAPIEAFENYHITDGETTVGVNIDSATSHLKHARLGKKTNDPVSLTMDKSGCVADIERDYNGTQTVRTHEWLNIDPDSVRGEPDLPELGLPWTATVDTEAFVDAVKVADTTSDHCIVREEMGDLVIGAEDDLTAAQTAFEGVAEQVDVDGLSYDPEGATSAYPLDYVTDIATALKRAKVDSVTLNWGAEFPFKLHFERTADDQTVYAGQFVVAPRIEG